MTNARAGVFTVAAGPGRAWDRRLLSAPLDRPNQSNAERRGGRRPARGRCSAGPPWLRAPGLPAGESAPAPAGRCPLSRRGRGPGCSAPPGCLGAPWAAARAAMTDFGEEQRNELEALESIYPDSFTGDFGGRVPAAALGWGGMGRSRRPRPRGPRWRWGQRGHSLLRFFSPRVQALASDSAAVAPLVA